MAKLVFLPVEDQIQSSSYVLYDGALGTGGMLTIAEDTLRDIAGKGGHKISTHLYGQEINDETFAICKADLLLKGEADAGANILGPMTPTLPPPLSRQTTPPQTRSSTRASPRCVRIQPRT